MIIYLLYWNIIILTIKVLITSKAVFSFFVYHSDLKQNTCKMVYISIKLARLALYIHVFGSMCTDRSYF